MNRENATPRAIPYYPDCQTEYIPDQRFLNHPVRNSTSEGIQAEEG